MMNTGTWADTMTLPLGGSLVEYEKSIGNWERCGAGQQLLYYGLTKLDPRRLPEQHQYGQFQLSLSCANLRQHQHILNVLHTYCGHIMELKIGMLMLRGRLQEWDTNELRNGWNFEAQFKNEPPGQSGWLGHVANIRELMARIKASPTAQKELAGACAAAIVAGKREFEYSGYYFDEALVRDVLHG